MTSKQIASITTLNWTKGFRKNLSYDSDTPYIKAYCITNKSWSWMPLVNGWFVKVWVHRHFYAWLDRRGQLKLLMIIIGENRIFLFKVRTFYKILTILSDKDKVKMHKWYLCHRVFTAGFNISRSLTERVVN